MIALYILLRAAVSGLIEILNIVFKSNFFLFFRYFVIFMLFKIMNSSNDDDHEKADIRCCNYDEDNFYFYS